MALDKQLLDTLEFHIGSRVLSKVLLVKELDPRRIAKRVRKDVLLKNMDPECVASLALEFLSIRIEIVSPNEAFCRLCGARIVSKHLNKAIFFHLTAMHRDLIEELGRIACVKCRP